MFCFFSLLLLPSRLFLIILQRTSACFVSCQNRPDQAFRFRRSTRPSASSSTCPHQYDLFLNKNVQNLDSTVVIIRLCIDSRSTHRSVPLPLEPKRVTWSILPGPIQQSKLVTNHIHQSNKKLLQKRFNHPNRRANLPTTAFLSFHKYQKSQSHFPSSPRLSHSLPDSSVSLPVPVPVKNRFNIISFNQITKLYCPNQITKPPLTLLLRTKKGKKKKFPTWSFNSDR